MPIIPPDYGTGSSYYSQNFDNIQELLQRIYDNTNNVIVAKDVRDPLWTLWNKISGLSASLGSASISYSLGTPSTISVGGIVEGSTFSNATLTELFDQMLLPYVAPVVNNFGPSVLEKQFGDTIGLNLTYSINVGSLPLDSGYAIQFISPNPSSFIPNKIVTGNDPETGTTNNFSLTYSTSTFSVVNYVLATMSFRTTDLTVFTATTSIAQKHKRYYGQISIPIGFTPSNPSSVAAVSAYLNDVVIKGLSYSELSTNVNFSQAIEFNSLGQYFVFASPTVFGFNYPVGFYVDNIFTQNYTKVRSNSNLSNEFGFIAPYDVYILNDALYNSSLISTIPLPQGYLNDNFSNVINSVIIGDQGPTGPIGPTGSTGPNVLYSSLYSTGTPITGGTQSGIIFQDGAGLVSQSNNFLWNNIQNQFIVGTTSYRGSATWSSTAGTASIQLTTYGTYSFSLRNRNGRNIISAFDTGEFNRNQIVINDSGFDIGVGLGSVTSSVNIINDGSVDSLGLVLYNQSYNTQFSFRSDGRVWHGLFGATTTNYTSQHTIYDSYGIDLFRLLSLTQSTNAITVNCTSVPSINRFGFGSSSDTFLVSSVGTTSTVDLKVFNNISVKSGNNKLVGTVSLVSGSASIINSLVNPNSIVMVTRQYEPPMLTGTLGELTVEKHGGSFSIVSSSISESTVIGYLIINTY
jgi:hypothetical protein